MATCDHNHSKITYKQTDAGCPMCGLATALKDKQHQLGLVILEKRRLRQQLEEFERVDVMAKDRRKQTMQIATCVINKRLITFKPPFVFELEYHDDGMITANCNDILELNTNEKSLKKIRKSIEEGIELIWNDYVNCSILQLSKDAIMFRNKLKKRVK